MNMRETIIDSNPNNEDIVFLKGFDDSIIGTALCQGNTVVMYSIKSMVENLTTTNKMTENEAMEWLDFNTFFAYFGPHTPIYVEDYRR